MGNYVWTGISCMRQLFLLPQQGQGHAACTPSSPAEFRRMKRNDNLAISVGIRFAVPEGINKFELLHQAIDVFLEILEVMGVSIVDLQYTLGNGHTVGPTCTLSV